MFGLGKKDKLRKDLPPISIRTKPVKGIFGRTKWVPTSKREQRKLKAELMKVYPDRYFVDDLNEWNSVDERPSATKWVDDMEALSALLED